MRLFKATRFLHAGFWRRLRAAIIFQSKKFRRRSSKSSVTFCIAHFNAPEFLDAALHAVRRFYPDARVIVADASSEWRQYAAAQSVCRRHGAELHPLATRHRHTGLLNYMFRQIRSRVAVFLDQDCVLLEPLDPRIRRLNLDKALIGPRDEMRCTHPGFCAGYPELAGFSLRARPEFVHASLMVMDAPRIRAWSAKPFVWRNEWGRHPLERYYGLTELVRRNQPDGVLTLDSAHTGYGLGHVYTFNGSQIAYHQWYSGQVYGQAGKLDALFDADWLRAGMKRFLADYWAGKVDFRLAPATHKISGDVNR
jgi:hypothetical protein